MAGPDSVVPAGLVGGLVATAMVGHHGHRGWVYYLVVAPEHRGRGLAFFRRLGYARSKVAFLARRLGLERAADLLMDLVLLEDEPLCVEDVAALALADDRNSDGATFTLDEVRAALEERRPA